MFIQKSNLCRTTTLGTLNLWPLLTGGHCSEVALFYKIENGTPKWWLLYAGGRYSEVVSSGLTEFFIFDVLGM